MPPPIPRGAEAIPRLPDWLAVALDLLVSDGVEQVKVLTLGERLGVSRSSFYWYFQSRQDLLNALLDRWQETNTAAIEASASAPADTVTAAVCNVFRAMLDPKKFNNRLDFAIREWARRSGPVRRALDLSDNRRLTALADMFARHGYDGTEATVRARVLYYMQIGYNDAELQEPFETRMAFLPGYLLTFTGREASADEIAAFRDDAARFLTRRTPRKR